MKKLGFIFLLIVLFWALPGHDQVFASNNAIFLDGQELEQPANAKAGLIDGSVMVPIRIISEGLGYDVSWQKEIKTVTIKQGDKHLELAIDSKEALVNGSFVALNTAPLLHNDTTFVPLRFVSEQMGLDVEWDNSTKTVYLNNPTKGSGSGVVEGTASSNPAESVENVLLPTEKDSSQASIQPVDDASGNEAPTMDTSSSLAVVNDIIFTQGRLSIVTDRSIEPKVFHMTEPDRIVIDVENARFSDLINAQFQADVANQGVFAVMDDPAVSQIRYSLFSNSPSTVRIVIDLVEKRDFQLVQENGQFHVDLLLAETVNPQVPVREDGKFLVVIDPGHGGKDPGVTAASGAYEKEFNLSIALKVQALLEKESDIITVMTRTEDVYPTLDERVQLANTLQADIFISIHGNGGSATASGTETFYTRDDSLLLAETVHKHYLPATTLPDRKVKRDNYKVTRETTMPAILLEAGFLSNPNDENVLKDPVVRDSIAKGIVAGIKEYFGLN